MNTNSMVRQRIKQQRRALPARLRAKLASAMCRNLVSRIPFRHSRNIAAYLAVGGEMSLEPVIREIRHRNKHCFLPRLQSRHKQDMVFAPYYQHSLMRRNRFGIPEPLIHTRHCRSARQLDLVLVPLVAFDRNGNRLGMGGGYYDRTFAFVTARNHWRRPRLIGIAYEFQLDDSIQSQPWDVRLDAVVTEKRYYGF